MQNTPAGIRRDLRRAIRIQIIEKSCEIRALRDKARALRPEGASSGPTRHQIHLAARRIGSEVRWLHLWSAALRGWPHARVEPVTRTETWILADRIARTMETTTPGAKNTGYRIARAWIDGTLDPTALDAWLTQAVDTAA